MIKKGADIYTQDNQGRTPLHIAIFLQGIKDKKESQTSIIDTILSQEKKLNRILFFHSVGNICQIKDAKQKDPIDIAINAYQDKPINLQLFKRLRKHLVSQNKKYTFFNKQTFEYSPFGGEKLIEKIDTFLNENNKQIIDDAPQLRVKTYKLHQAIDRYDTKEVNNLITKGLSLHARNERKETPLIRAASLYSTIPSKTESLKLIIQSLLEEENILNQKRSFLRKQNISSEQNSTGLNAIDIIIGKHQATLKSKTAFDTIIFDIFESHLNEQNREYTLFNGENLLKKIRKHKDLNSKEATKEALPNIPTFSSESELSQDKKPLPKLENAIKEPLKKVYPLHEAIKRGDVEKLNILLTNEQNLYEKDATGNTVLHLAIDTFSIGFFSNTRKKFDLLCQTSLLEKVVKILLKKESELNIINHEKPRSICLMQNKYGDDALDLVIYAYKAKKLPDTSINALMKKHLISENLKHPLLKKITDRKTYMYRRLNKEF